MRMKQVVVAVVVSIIGISVANTGLILTVDGSNPTGIACGPDCGVKQWAALVGISWSMS